MNSKHRWVLLQAAIKASGSGPSISRWWLVFPREVKAVKREMDTHSHICAWCLADIWKGCLSKLERYLSSRPHRALAMRSWIWRQPERYAWAVEGSNERKNTFATTKICVFSSFSSSCLIWNNPPTSTPSPALPVSYGGRYYVIAGGIEHRSRGSSGPMNYWWESRRDPPRPAHFTSSSPHSRVNQAKEGERGSGRKKERRSPLFSWRTPPAAVSGWIMDGKTTVLQSVLNFTCFIRTPTKVLSHSGVS